MFKATTDSSDKFKALFEILFQLCSSNVKLYIDSDGIRCYDESDSFSFAYVGNKTCFDTYVFDYPNPIIIGLGQHVNGQLKDIKSKCRLTITISGDGNDNCPYEFSVKANRKTVTSKQHVADGQAIHGGYDVTLKLLAERLNSNVVNFDRVEENFSDKIKQSSNYTRMQPCDFVQLCKSFKTNNYVVDVQTEFSQLHFITNVAGISEVKKTFGEYDKNDYDLVRHAFKVDQLSKLVKMAAFAKTVLKLRFTTNGIIVVIDDGDLGSLRVHANKYVDHYN